MGDSTTTTQSVLSKPERFSYWFIAAVLILVGVMHLATPLITILFAYLALTKLHFIKRRGKWLPILLLIFLVTAMLYGLGYFTNQTVRALPDIADKAIPAVIEWAKK